MYSKEQAHYIAQQLGVKFDHFSFEDFYRGLNLELEHGTKHPATNITNDHIELSAKIALAHLNELPNYYNKDYGLSVFEDYLKKRLHENEHHH